MNTSEIVENERTLMTRGYAKKALMLVKGQGATVWDADGRGYLDCTSSYGVAFLGHCNPAIVKAIREQAGRLIACHGSFYNDMRSELVKEVVDAAPKGLESVFLSTSGAEAVEAALKFTRRSIGKPEIIAMMGSFHGKTMGALSATWEKKYREPFEPLVPGFRHVPYGDSEKVRQAVSEKTGGIIVEPIQGEGGVRVPPAEFLRELREICDERNISLIFDEVQTGFGRTGKLFALEHYDVIPDVLCLGKAVAGGLPMGITIANSKVTSMLKIGEHSSTFGGGPLVCAAAKAAFELMIGERLWERAAKLGEYFQQGLKRIQSNSSIIREVRGLGLMLGIEFKFDVLNIITECMKEGVLVLDAGRNVVRLLPPVVVDLNQVDQAVDSLGTAVEIEERARLPTAATR